MNDSALLLNLGTSRKLGNYSKFLNFEININFIQKLNVIQRTVYAALSTLASLAVFNLYHRSITLMVIATKLLLPLIDVLVNVSVILR